MNKILRKLLAITAAAAILTLSVGELYYVYESQMMLANGAVAADITDIEGSCDDIDAEETTEISAVDEGSDDADSKADDTETRTVPNDMFALNFLAPVTDGDGNTVTAEEYYVEANGYSGFELDFELPKDWELTIPQDENAARYFYCSASDASLFPTFDEYIYVWSKGVDGNGYKRIRYQYKNITVDGVAVTYIGAIEFNGELYYYYSTAGQGNSATVGVTVMKEDDGETDKKFVLNYEQAPYEVSYSVKIEENGVIRDVTEDDVSASELTLDAVFGENRVQNLPHDSYYAFSVDVPVEYTAEVYRYSRYESPDSEFPDAAQVKRTDDYPIGTEPIYKMVDGKIIALEKDANDDPLPAALSLSRTFPTSDVIEDRHIEVILTKRDTVPQFSVKDWLTTNNASNRATTGADDALDRNGNYPNINSGDKWGWQNDESVLKDQAVEMAEEKDEITKKPTGAYTYTWIFQTNANEGGYTLDTMELNGVSIAIPFSPQEDYGEVEVWNTNHMPKTVKEPELGLNYTLTTLPDGAVARLDYLRLFAGRPNNYVPQRVYKLTITGAHTGVTVTNANLMIGAGSNEISVYSLTGTYCSDKNVTAVQQYSASGWSNEWKQGSVMVDFPYENIYSGSDGSGNLRFKLLESYEDVSYELKGTDGNVLVDKEGNKIKGQLDNKAAGEWYYITLNRPADEQKISLLYIYATPVKYIIRYNPDGEYSDDIVTLTEEDELLIGQNINWDKSVMPSIWEYPEEPGKYYDSNDVNGNVKFYDMTEHNMVTILYNTPVDLNGKMKFVGWEIEKDSDDKRDGNYEYANSKQYINSGEGISLADIAKYWYGEIRYFDEDGTKRYVINLKAVWEAIPPERTEDIEYEVVGRIVDEEGLPIEGRELIDISLDEFAVVYPGTTQTTVFIDVYAGQILKWLKKNPTYSIRSEGRDLVQIVKMPSQNEAEAGISATAGISHTRVNQDNYKTQVILDFYENRGPLTFNIEKGDKYDECENTFDITIEADEKSIPITGLFFEYSDTDGMLVENINPDTVKELMFDKNNTLTIKDLPFGQEITIYVIKGKYTVTEKRSADNEENYDVYVDEVETGGDANTDSSTPGDNENEIDATIEAGFNNANSSGTLVSSNIHYVFTNNLKPAELTVIKTQKKSDSNDEASTDTLYVTPGDTVEYTVTVKNDDDYTAHDKFTITDTLPAGVRFVDDVNPFEGREDVTVTETDGIITITWTIDEKPEPEDHYSLSYSVTVPFVSADETTLTSTSEVSETDYDGDSIYYANAPADYDGSPSTVELIVNTCSLSVSVEIENTKGGKVDENKEFVYVISGLPDNEYPMSDGSTLTVADGTAEITVKHGETLTINGIPDGTSYTVKEKSAQNAPYSLKSSDNTAGTFDYDDEAVITAEFIYEYTPDDAEWAPLPVNKTLIGREEWAEGDSFTFSIATTGANSGNVTCPSDVTIDHTMADKTASFGDVVFSAAGTYTLTVTETKGSIVGIKYDETAYTVTVKVTDDFTNGTLVASVDESVTAITSFDFTNYYRDYAFTLDGTANVTGPLDKRTGYTGETFTYTVTGKDYTNTVEFKYDPETSEVPFDLIALIDEVYYTEGIYEYTISQSSSAYTSGMTYNETVYVVTVTVTETGNKFSITYTIEDEDGNKYDSIDFVNTYAVKPTTAKIQGIKTIDGRSWTTDDNGRFKFVLVPDNAAYPVPANTTVSAVNGVFTFGDIEYTAAGIYTYTVSEDKTDDGKNGLIFDKNTYTVTVTVTDKDGQLSADISYSAAGKTGDEMTFTNKYVSNSAELNIGVTTTLNGRDWISGDLFRFILTLTDIDAETAPASVAVGSTWTTAVDNGKDEGTAYPGTFGAILLDAKGTYTFTLIEEPIDAAGLKSDPVTYTIVVTVKDDKNGTLYIDDTEITSDMAAGTFSKDALPFVNTYKAASAKLSDIITITKVLEGRDWRESDKFDFIIKIADEYGDKVTITDNTLTVYGSDDADGPISVNGGAVTFNEAGDYKFTVSEKPHSIIGIAPNNTVMTFTVRVTDDNNGQLSAEVIDGGEFTFTNIYSSEGVWPPEVTKQLTGRAWRTEDKFAFTLELIGTPDGVTADDITMPADITVTGTVGTRTEAHKSFDNVIFSKPGIYTFKLSEKPADSETDLIYDSGYYVLTADVEDDGYGSLIPQLIDRTRFEAADNNGTAYNNNDYIFTNTYPAKDEVQLSVTKVINGRDVIAGDEFSFTLTAAEDYGNAMEFIGDTEITLTIADIRNDGTLFKAFDNIAFYKAGSYDFIIKETAGLDNIGMSYDTADHIVTVNVVETNDGLTAQVEGNANVTVTNTYSAGKTYLIPIAKILNGKPWEDEEFEFTIAPADSKGDTAQAIEDGYITIAKDSVVLDADNASGAFELAVKSNGSAVNSYIFRITETDTGIENMTYANPYILLVTVVDDMQGNLTVTACYDDEDGTVIIDEDTDSLVFVNTYEAPVPPTTEPPETEPPVTDAPATEPPTTDAPATEPPMTDAPATEPPATDAPATEPSATDAPATDAPTTEAPADADNPSTGIQVNGLFAVPMAMLAAITTTAVKRRRK
ncbi:MAG: DUF11 domain-containing protein [Eubacterium sp.]|nr:DUF11 domain-containing protein [Eubacterium sp.]